jgi:hypothetical protein
VILFPKSVHANKPLRSISVIATRPWEIADIVKLLEEKENAK